MTSPSGAPKPPTAQLSYASAEGGYGIRATSGDLDAEETEILVKGINRDRREFGEEVPTFASAEQATGFLRAMSYRPTTAGLATWLSGPAGTDGSGRPGNVFTQVLLERRPRPAGSPRPVERWRSTSWLMPFGAAAVASAALPEPFGSDRPVVNRASACAFVADPDVWRLGSLCEILDALTAADGSPVVVGVASPDEAALWMGVVSHLIAAHQAEELSFALWESLTSMHAIAPTPRIVFVRESALDPAATAAITPHVVRTSEEPSPREWVAPEPGQPAPSAFGPLAVALFSLFDDPTDVLAELEAIGDRVGPDARHLGWPLAMALASRVSDWPELAAPVAQVLRDEAVESLDQFPDLWSRCVSIFSGESGESADDAWQELARLGRPATGGVPVPVTDALRKIHVLRCLRDPRSLIQRRSPTLGVGRWSAGDDVEVAAAVREALTFMNAVDPLAAGVGVLRIADLVIGETVSGQIQTGLLDLLQAGVRERVLPLVHSSPIDLVRHIGPIHPSALAIVVRPSLADAPVSDGAREGRPGRRLAGPLVEWLYPEFPTPVPGRAPSELDLEAAGHVTLGGHQSPLWPWARVVLLEYARSAREPRTPVAPMLIVCLPGGDLSIAEVLALRLAGTDRVSLTHVAQALSVMGPDERADALRLCNDVLQTPPADRAAPELFADLISLLSMPQPERFTPAPAPLDVPSAESAEAADPGPLRPAVAQGSIPAGSDLPAPAFGGLEHSSGPTTAPASATAGNSAAYPRPQRVRDLQRSAARALTVLADLQSVGLVPFGEYWSTRALPWLTLVDPMELRGVAGELVYGRKALVEGAVWLIEADVMSTQDDGDPHWTLISQLARAAIQLDPEWPTVRDHQNSVLRTLVDAPTPEQPSAFDRAAHAVYAGLERKDLQACRDDIFDGFARFTELDRDAKKVINAWFDRVTGGTGLSSLFGRKNKPEDES